MMRNPKKPWMLIFNLWFPFLLASVPIPIRRNYGEKVKVTERIRSLDTTRRFLSDELVAEPGSEKSPAIVMITVPILGVPQTLRRIPLHHYIEDFVYYDQSRDRLFEIALLPLSRYPPEQIKESSNVLVMVGFDPHFPIIASPPVILEASGGRRFGAIITESHKGITLKNIFCNLHKNKYPFLMASIRKVQASVYHL